MPTELLPLAKIFNNRLFRIPDYQRGYAWGLRQLEDFWADIRRACSGRKHYCGQLTLERASEAQWGAWDEERAFIKDSGFDPFYVVDGQQRLTTAIILLQCTLEGFADTDTIAGLTVAKQKERYLLNKVGMLTYCLFGYEKDNPSHEFFRTQILGSPSNHYAGTRTLYTANLEAALRFFRERIKSGDLQREQVLKAIAHQFQFNVHELSDDIDVFVAFETMNNRGKILTRLELLKNRLIYLSTLAGGTEAARRQVRTNVNEVWKTVYQELGKQPHEPLDDDEFLRAHWIIFFGHDKDEPNPLTEFLLNQHFTSERAEGGEVTLSDIQAYVDSLQGCVRQWQLIHFPAENAVTLQNRGLEEGLTRLKRLGFGSLKPVILAVLASGTNNMVKTDVVDESERFVLLVRSLCSSRSHLGESDSYKTAHDIFKQRTSRDAAGWMLHQRIARHFTTAKFQSTVDDLYADPGRKGFYELSAIDFILFEYEEHLRVRGKNTSSKLNWDKFKGSRNSIEHIYPQKAEDSEWPAFASYAEDQKRLLCHCLGNLVPVTVAKNAALSRSSFKKKVKGTDNIPGFSQGSYSELEIAQNTDWTPEAILERGLTLLEFIETRWQVKLGTREEKAKLLKLEFLL